VLQHISDHRIHHQRALYSARLKITKMKVGVMAAYCDRLCVCVTVNYTHAQRVRICCHNIDLVHVNGHDRIILVIFSQALYKAL